jgi:hypothetical protein
MPKVKIIDKIKIFERAVGRKITPEYIQRGTRPILLGKHKPIAGNLDDK